MHKFVLLENAPKGDIPVPKIVRRTRATTSMTIATTTSSRDICIFINCHRPYLNFVFFAALGPAIAH